MSLYKTLFFLNIFLSLSFFVSCNKKLLVKATSKAESMCVKNTYYTIIKVDIEGQSDNLFIPFTLEMSRPLYSYLKCMLDGKDKQIFCTLPVNEKYFPLYEQTVFQFPYLFPTLDEVKWDESSFYNLVYRKVWYVNKKCGFEHLEDASLNKTNDFDLKWNIIKFYEDTCKSTSYYSDSYVKFLADVKLTESKKFKELKLASNFTIKLKQKIWLPISTEGEKNPLNDFPLLSYAYCKLADKNQEITKNNFDKVLTLNCNLIIRKSNLIHEKVTLPNFQDTFYITSKINEDIKLEFLKSYFTYNSDVKLGINNQVFCPQKPLFTLTEKEKNINFEKNDGKNAVFTIRGTLGNGYSYKNNILSPITNLENDIKFSVVLVDILNSKSSDKSFLAQCTIPKGAIYNSLNSAIANCVANPTILDQTKIDFTLNWDNPNNNIFESILIHWPTFYTLENYRSIYSNEIQVIGIKQDDHGCVNNELYYFYLNLKNLGTLHMKMSFPLSLSQPKGTKATCSPLSNDKLKCTIDTRFRKILIAKKIELPHFKNVESIKTDDSNNIYLSIPINNDIDSYIIARENCGNNPVVGALKEVGLGTKSIVIIIVSSSIFLCGSITLILFIAVKRVKNKIKKAGYFTQNDELPGSSRTIGVKESNVNQDSTTANPNDSTKKEEKK